MIFRYEEKKFILSIDAETDGLWGKPFCIGAVVYEVGRNSYTTFGLKEIDSFCFKSDSLLMDKWTWNNVHPQLSDVPEIKEEELFVRFAEFYKKYFESEIIWHMGHVVEAYLFRILVEKKLLGQFEAPYCPIEISEMLRAAGEKPDSVDDYLKRKGIEISGNTHNPLYDARAAAAAYNHLRFCSN